MSLKSFIESKKENLKIAPPSQSGDVVPIIDELLINEYNNGVQTADSCMIPKLDEVFSWKRGFQNCWTGWPNDGKTQFTLFVMLIKAIKSDWKFVIWSPEMKSSSFVNGNVIVHYNDLINILIWTLDGRTPYKHVAEKYRCDRIPLKEYMALLPLVKKHFITIDPKDKTSKSIYKSLKSLYEVEGFDGILIDPFKNIQHEINMRDDIYMEQLFATFKDLAIETNTVMNWIAHPKANQQRVRTDKGVQTLIPCDQFMLNGGAAWDNSMDGIYSVFRPNTLNDVKDPMVTFLNQKQRKQELTTERGACTNILFNIKTRRYIFDGYDPIESKVTDQSYSLPKAKNDFSIVLPYKDEEPF